jgi:hypothetical protein
LPFVGALVRGRQSASNESFNVAALNDVLEPIGAQLAPSTRGGHAAVQAAGDEITAVYQRAVPMLRGQRDAQMDGAYTTIANTLTRDQRLAFTTFLDRELNNVVGPHGIINGDDIQHLLGTVRAEATHLTTSQTATHHDRELGRAFGRMADEIETNLGTHSPPAATELFRQANEAFANLVRVEKAAGSVAADSGVFSPAQLLNAVKSSDRSARKRNVGRGQALMQGLAGDAKSVMARRVNDSGTPERGAIVAALAAPHAIPMAALTAALLAGLYTPWGSAAFRRAAAGGAGPRQAIANRIRAGVQRGAPAAAASDPIRQMVDSILQSARCG